MVFIGEEKLSVMTLDDVVDFLFDSIDVIDELCVVFGDLLIVGEFFGLCQEGIFAFFCSVCAHSCFRAKVGRRDYEFLWGFAFVHTGKKLINVNE